MLDIILIFILILVVFYDSINQKISGKNTFLTLFESKNKNSNKLVYSNTESILLVCFSTLVLSLFFKSNLLSKLILDFTSDNLPIIFVYEELVFFVITIILAVWVVLKYHFINLKRKQIIAREFFNLIFLMIFLALGSVFFHIKNQSDQGRLIIGSNKSPVFTETNLSQKDLSRKNYKSLTYNDKYYSFKSPNGSFYPNRLFIRKEISRKKDANFDDLFTAEYQTIVIIYYVYGFNFFLYGFIIFYFSKFMIAGVMLAKMSYNEE